MKNLPIKSESFQYLEKSFKEWLDVLGYSQSTVYQLPNYIRELFYWLENEKKITQINQVTKNHIKEHYNNLKSRTNKTTKGGLSNNYLNKHLQGFYKFMDYLRQSGKIEIAHLNITREENNSKAIQVLSVNQIKQFYEVTKYHSNGLKWEFISSRDRAMLTVFYSCGLRRNEGYHLNLEDINFDRKMLHVKKGKNYKERFVPFNKSNSKILETYIYDYRQQYSKNKNTRALFIGTTGKRLESQSLAIRIKLLKQKIDDLDLQQKDITLHTLRHSIATHLLQAGMSLENISRFLGHSSLESTQIYTHLLEEQA